MMNHAPRERRHFQWPEPARDTRRPWSEHAMFGLLLVALLLAIVAVIRGGPQ